MNTTYESLGTFDKLINWQSGENKTWLMKEEFYTSQMTNQTMFVYLTGVVHDCENCQKCMYRAWPGLAQFLNMKAPGQVNEQGKLPAWGKGRRGGGVRAHGGGECMRIRFKIRGPVLYTFLLEFFSVALVHFSNHPWHLQTSKCISQNNSYK